MLSVTQQLRELTAVLSGCPIYESCKPITTESQKLQEEGETN